MSFAKTDIEELQGFSYVRTKNLSQLRKERKRGSKVMAADQYCLGTVRKAFDMRQQQLLTSPFLQAFEKLFQDLQAKQSFPSITHIRMVGIGTLKNKPSLIQLAFGLHLAASLGCLRKSILICDPMFSAVDKQFLSEIGLSVVDPTEAQQFDMSVITLLIAPHVPKSVYEATLRSYWRPNMLKNLVLLGNDLRHYQRVYSCAELRKHSPCILAIHNILEVAQLPTNFEHNNVFNDLGLQWFTSTMIPEEIDFDSHQIEKEHFEKLDEVSQG